MTLTTANLTLPYPVPSDARGAGANAIRDLALAVETAVWPMSTIATIPQADSPSATGAGNVEFPGTPNLAGFTYGSGVLTYTGPKSRLFVVFASVEVEHGSGGSPVSSIQSTVELKHNGTAFAGSNDLVSGTSADLGVRRHVHNITVPMLLNPGDTLTVVASAVPAGVVGQCGLRAYPMGPLDT